MQLSLLLFKQTTLSVIKYSPSYLNSQQMDTDTGAFGYLELVLVPVFSKPSKSSLPEAALTEMPHSCSPSESACRVGCPRFIKGVGFPLPNT